MRNFILSGNKYIYWALISVDEAENKFGIFVKISLRLLLDVQSEQPSAKVSFGVCAVVNQHLLLLKEAPKIFTGIWVTQLQKTCTTFLNVTDKFTVLQCGVEENLSFTLISLVRPVLAALNKSWNMKITQNLSDELDPSGRNWTDNFLIIHTLSRFSFSSTVSCYKKQYVSFVVDSLWKIYIYMFVT